MDEHKDNFEYTMKSWIEQRTYGFDLPRNALSENHPLRKYLDKEDEGLVVCRSSSKMRRIAYSS